MNTTVSDPTLDFWLKQIIAKFDLITHKDKANDIIAELCEKYTPFFKRLTRIGVSIVCLGDLPIFKRYGKKECMNQMIMLWDWSEGIAIGDYSKSLKTYRFQYMNELRKMRIE